MGAMRSSLRTWAVRIVQANALFWRRQGVTPFLLAPLRDRVRQGMGERLHLTGCALEQAVEMHVDRLFSQTPVDLRPSQRSCRWSNKPLRIQGLEHWNRARRSGRGVALGGLHFGSAGALIHGPFRRLLARQGAAVPDVCLTDAVIERDSVGTMAPDFGLILGASRPQSYRTALKCLRGGGTIAGPLDRIAPIHRRGRATVRVRFLDAECAAPRGMFWAVVAAEAQMLLCTLVERTDSMELVYHAPLQWDRTRPSDEQVQELANAFYSQAEAVIRAEPWQWMQWEELAGGTASGGFPWGRGVPAPGNRKARWVHGAFWALFLFGLLFPDSVAGLHRWLKHRRANP